MIKQLIPVFLLLKLTKCSQVLDHHSQRVLKIADFCPETPLCPEGSHVMCSYQSNQRFGPRCADPQPKATMNEKLSQLYIDIVNMVRSEAANGKAIGNGTLPRAYGLMRLKWDEELATFAQTLADQCVLRHDLCRASQKFPNPGQTIGYIHLTLNDWQPIRNKKKKLPKELTDETLEYAIHNILKTAYDTKIRITSADVNKVPDFIKEEAAKRMYFQLVSRSTHVGCGLSAFSDISIKTQTPKIGTIKYGRETLNVILLVCNYGEDVKERTSIYDTSPRPGTSPKCGCPVGSWEDENCLCNEIIATTTSTTVATTTLKCAQGKASPTVVLLPIVTVEDAPPDKLFENFNGGVGHSGENINIGRNSNLDLFNEQVYPFLQGAKNPANHENPEILAIESHEDHLNKELYKPYPEQLQQYNRARAENRIHNDYIPSKKLSIFARAPQFRLPAKNTNDNDYIVKKDVAPRKDFSNIQNVVTDYFKKKNAKDLPRNSPPNKVDELLNKIIVKNFSDATTEIVLYRSEDKTMNEHNEQHFIHDVVHDDIPNNNLNVQRSHSDHKLMALLDTLEREVKHIDLDGNKKELFDAKLRKIYGTVVGKPVELLTDPRKEDKTNNNFEEFKKYDRYYDTNFVTDHKRQPFDSEYENLNKSYSNGEIINERLEKQLHGRSFELYDYVDDNKFSKPWKYPDAEQKYELRRQKTEGGSPTDRFKYRDCDKLHEPDNKLRNIKTSRYLSPINRNDRNNREEKRNKAGYMKETPESVLSKDRRKFYQDKLDAIEKKLQNSRRQKENDHFNGKRQNRRMLSDIQNRRSKRRFDEFYLPDRAKWIGF